MSQSMLSKSVFVVSMLGLGVVLLAVSLRPVAPSSDPVPANKVVSPQAAKPAPVDLMPNALPVLDPQAQQRNLESQVQSATVRVKKTPECQALLASARETLGSAEAIGAKQARLAELHQKAVNSRCL